MIQITIKYFGALREQLSISEQIVEFEEPLTTLALWQHLHPERETAHLKVAVNQAYQSWDFQIQHSCEVAFFPPVTGG